MSADRPRPALASSAVTRKIIGALVAGTIALLGSLFADQSPISALILSVLVGGITLLTQLLVDFEERLHSIEARQYTGSRDAEAAQLIRQVADSALEEEHVTDLLKSLARFNGDVSFTVKAFAELEIARLSELLRQLKSGKAVYEDGEDHDWILGLTTIARDTIDATSTTSVDGYGESFKGGFWASDHGQRYLKAQAEAVKRESAKRPGENIVIRRLFIMERSDDLVDPDFLAIVHSQTAVDIRVRALHYDQVPPIFLRSSVDFILFDTQIAYELIPAPSSHQQPGYLMTQLLTKRQDVTNRKDRFETLWNLAIRDLDATPSPPLNDPA
ncbi:MAG: hypothetical protein ABIS86_01875 [Streptosporangiaceae bacterium]